MSKFATGFIKRHITYTYI